MDKKPNGKNDFEAGVKPGLSTLISQAVFNLRINNLYVAF